MPGDSNWEPVYDIIADISDRSGIIGHNDWIGDSELAFWECVYGNGVSIHTFLPDTVSAGVGDEGIPIAVSIGDDVTGLDITSFHFEFVYDPDIITYNGIDDIGTLAEGWTITTSDDFGVLTVDGFSEASMENYGILLNLLFDVVGEAGSECELDLDNVEFNGATIHGIDYMLTPTIGSYFIIEPSIAIPNLQDFGPQKYVLYPNYPNPFNPTTTISFYVPFSQLITLKIYDITGRLVRDLIDHKVISGYNTILWDGKDDNGIEANSGLYLYQLESNFYQETRQMLLLK